MVCHSDLNYCLQKLLLVICQYSESISDEKLMIVSAFISVHISRKQRKIKKASVLATLPHSLGP